MIMMTVQNQNNRNFHTNMEDCLKLQSNCNSSTEILHIMKSIKDINVSKKKKNIYIYMHTILLEPKLLTDHI